MPDFEKLYKDALLNKNGATSPDEDKSIKNIYINSFHNSQRDLPDFLRVGDTSKYDEGYIPSEGDLAKFRARNQPWSHQAANSIVGGIGSGVLTFAEEVGYLGDFENNINRLQGVEEVESNWLSDAAKRGKENINEALPIFRRSDETFDWGDSGFYWEALKGVIDSAVGFGLTGVAAGGIVGGVAKLGGLALRGARVANYVNTIGKGAQTLSTAFITNYGEGKMMALETYENTKSELKNKFPEMSDIEINRLAGEAADDFQLRNMAFLLTDAVALSGLAKGLGTTRKLIKEKNFKTFRKDFLSIGRQNPLMQAGAEGLEEIGQNIIQEEADYQAQKKAGADVSDISSNFLDRAISFGTSDKALLEGLMGVVGGPVQYAFVQGPSDLVNRASMRDIINRQKEQIQNNESFLKDKLSSVVNKQRAKQQALIDGQEEYAEFLDNEEFINLAYDNFERGTTEQLERNIQDLLSNEEQAKSVGLEEGYKGKLNEYLGRLKVLEKGFIQTSSKFSNPIFRPFIKQITTTEQLKNLTNRQISSIDGQIATIRTNTINDINKERTEVVNSIKVEIPILEKEIEAYNKVLNNLDNARSVLQRRNESIVGNRESGIVDTRTIKKTNKLSKLINDTEKRVNNIRKRIDQYKKDLESSNEKLENFEQYINNKDYDNLLEKKAQIEVENKRLIDYYNELTNESSAKKLLEDNLQAIKTEKQTQELQAKQNKAKKDKINRAVERAPKEVEKPIIPKTTQEIPTAVGTGVVGTPEIIRAQSKVEEPTVPTLDKTVLEDDKPTTEYTNIDQKVVATDIENTINEVAKSNNNISINELIDDKGKINESYNALASVSRDYEEIKPGKLKDINNKLSKELRDVKLLHPDEYQSGTPLTLRIDREFEEEINGVLTTYDDLAEKGVGYIPIAVYNQDGIKIAYIHDIDYPNNRVLSDNIESDKSNIIQLRQAIVNAGGEIETKVIEKRNGYLIKTFDNSEISLSSAFEDPNLILGIQTSEKFFNNQKTNIDNLNIINKTILKSGTLYGIAPVNKDKYVALPFKRTKLSEKDTDTVRQVINVYLNVKSGSANLISTRDNNIINGIKEKENIDITTRDGLVRFIQKYTFITNPEGDLESHLIEYNDGVSMLSILNNGIKIGQGKGLSFINAFGVNGIIAYKDIQGNDIARDTRKVLDAVLTKNLSNMYYHVDKNLINGDNIINLPTINEDGTLSYNSQSYTKFIKDKHTSNILSLKAGERWVYTISPIIRFDTSFASKKEPTSTTIVEESTKKKAEAKIITTKSGRKVFVSSEGLFSLEEKDQTTSKYKLSGLNAIEQENLINDLVYEINFNLIQASEQGIKKSTIKEELTKVTSFLHELYGIWQEVDGENSQLMLDRINNIFDQWDKVTYLIVRRLNQIQGIKINYEYNLEEDNEFGNEKVDFERSSIEVDPRNTMSRALKKFLSSIPRVDQNGTPLHDKFNYLKTDTLVPFGEVFNNIQAAVAGSDLRGLGMEANYNKIRLELLKNTKTKPYLKAVVDKLDEAPQEIRNQFTSEMTKHYVNMKTVLVDKDGVVKIIDTNSNSSWKILVEDWRNNISNNPIYTFDSEKREYYINEESKDKINIEYNSLINNSTTDGWKEWLSNLGIKVELETLQSIVLDKQSFIRSIRKGGIFFEINDNIRKRGNSTLLENDLFDEAKIRSLARLDTKNKPLMFTNSHKDGEGKTIWSYSYNKYFTNRVRSLVKDNELINRLGSYHFNKSSLWLEDLIQEDSILKDVLSTFYLDILKNDESNTKGKAKSLNLFELEVAALGLFANNGNIRRGKRVGYFTKLVPDKPLVMGVSTTLEEVKLDGDRLSTDTVDLIYRKIVEPEIDRILAFKDTGINIAGFKAGSQLFYFIPELNELEEIWDYKEGTSGKLLKEKAALNVAKIKEVITKHIDDLVEEKKEDWKSYGIYKDGSKSKLKFIDTKYQKYVGGKISGVETNNKIANYIAYDYVVNYLLFNTNFHQTIIGDPALYYKKSKTSNNSIDHVKSTWDNIDKRLAMLVAPGRELAMDEESYYYTQGFLKDSETNSLNIDKYLDKIRPNYEKINGTDAQEFTTVEEAVRVLQMQGLVEYNKGQEIIKKARTGNLSEEEIGIVLQPTKPVYGGSSDSEIGTGRMVYIKSSSFPLIPQMIKGMQIEALEKAMRRDGVDRVAFNSAVKLGNILQPQEVYFNKYVNIDIKFTPENTLALSRENFRIQQDNPLKAEGLVNTGSQERILITSGLLDEKILYKGEENTIRQLRSRLEGIYNEIWKNRSDEFKKKYANELEEVNIKEIKKLIREEAETRGYPINDLDILDLDGEEFIKALFFTNMGFKVEPMLSSLINNKIRKIKQDGVAGILGTEEGFSWLEDFETQEQIDTYIENNKSSIVFTDNWKGRLQSNQILVSFKFKDAKGRKLSLEKYTKNGKLSSKFSKELLKVFGYRIPTSKQNSMASLEIAGFLPESVGDLVIPSRDLVQQMGYDFDNDKLYIYLYRTDNVEETISKLVDVEDRTESGLLNEALDIRLAILDATNEKIKLENTIPINYGKLFNDQDNNHLSKIIGDKVENVKTYSPSSDKRDKETFLYSIEAKIGVGVFSLTSVFIAAIEGRGDVFIRDVDKRPFTIRIAGKVSNKISDSNTNNGNSKGSIISYFQNAAVDNQKIRALQKLNINNITYDAINTLLTTGFEEDVIVSFLNQDIIREYVNLVKNLKNEQLEAYSKPEDIAIKRLSEKYGDIIEADINLVNNTSINELINLIGRGLENKEIQVASLKLFMDLTDIGKQIRLVQSVTNVDSSGFPKSLLESNIKEELVSILPTLSRLGNVENILKDTIKGSAIDYTLKLNNRLWNQLYPYTKPLFKYVVAEIEKITDNEFSDITSKSRLRKQIYNSLRSYYIDQLGIDRSRLFLETQNNKSLASIVRELLGNNSNLQANAFLTRLRFSIRDKGSTISLIKYNAAADAELSEDFIHNAFIDLYSNDTIYGNYNGIEYTGRKIAEDLISYALGAGAKQEAIEFYKYIPSNFFKERLDNITQDLQNFDDLGEQNREGYYTISSFVKQWAQHNPWYFPSLDPSKVIMSKSEDSFKIGNEVPDELLVERLIYSSEENKEILVGVPREFTSLKDSNGNWKIYQYKGSGVYQRIPTLGKFGLSEYQYKVDNATSIIKENNVNNIVVVGNERGATEKVLAARPINSSPIYKTTTKALDWISKSNNDPYYKALATAILNSSYKTTDILFVDTPPVEVPEGKQWNGYFDGEKIYIRKGLKGAKLKKTILHEILHNELADVFQQFNENSSKLSEVQRTAINKIDNFRTILRSKLPENSTYQNIIGNRDEFISEVMTNENFQKTIKDIKGEYSQGLNWYDSLMSFIKEVFSGIFGDRLERDSILTQTMDATLSLINDQDINNKPFEIKRENLERDLGLFSIEDERYQKSIDDRKLRISQLEDQIATIRNTTKDIKKINQLQDRIESLKEDIKALDRITSLSDFLAYGERDLEEVRQIIDSPSISIEDTFYAERLIKQWQDAIELYFDDAEKLSDSPTLEEYQKLGNKADRYEVVLRDIQLNLLRKWLSEQGEDINILREMKRTKDIDPLYAETFDISRTDNAVLQVVAKTVWEVNGETRKEAENKYKELSDLTKEALPEFKKLSGKDSNPYDIMIQRRADGTKQDRIVHKYTSEFFETKNSKRRSAEISGKWDDYYNWLRENTLLFDYRKLFRLEDVFEGEDLELNKTKVIFDKDSSDIQEHIKELKTLLGETEYQRLYNRLEAKLEEYKNNYLATKSILIEELGEEEGKKKLQDWVYEDSPYWHSESYYAKKKVIPGELKAKGFKYNYEIASKAEWYDKNFEKIASNDKTLRFYEFFMDTLKEVRDYLPETAREKLGANSIPYIEKSLVELFSKEGFTAGLKGVFNSAVKGISTSDINQTVHQLVDPITGEEINKIQANIGSSKEKVNELYELFLIDHKVNFNQEPDGNQKRKYYKQAQDIVNKDRSFDLGVALKSIIAVGLNYKHKAKIEAPIRLATQMIKNTQELKRSSDGRLVLDKNDKPIYKEDSESFKNIKKQLDNFMDIFYGKPQEEGLKSTKKVYTSEESSKKKQLEELLIKNKENYDVGDITVEEFEAIELDIEIQLDNLGRQITGTKVIKNAIKFFGIKAMSYNWFSAFTSIGFGVISNFTESAANEFFTQKEIFEATGLTLHSIGKNLTLNTIESKVTKKIRALAEKYELLQFDYTEFGETVGALKVFKRFGPFKIFEHSELLNKIPVMIAMMKHQGIWDKYNENGEWVGEDKEPNIKIQLTQVISKLHGNYNPDATPRVSRHTLGQALGQFRRWFYEALASRFEAEKSDQLLGTRRKGRYRSYSALFEGKGIINNTLFTLKQLGGKLIGINTKFEDRFNEVDAANLRRNMNELLIYTTIAGVGLMLKHMVEGDDDDKKRFVLYTMINTLTRLQTDISLYVNPLSLEAILKRPVPVSQLVIDTSQWLDSAYDLMIGEDEIKSGIYAGNSKFLRETSEMLPFGTQVYRSLSIGKILY